MSEQPDLSTLPKRMRYAANVLEEAAGRADSEGIVRAASPGPVDLRKFADVWESADLSLLPDRMREAADVLDEVNELERRFGTDRASWTPSQLRNRAADWRDWWNGQQP